jgi:glycosyltransferase involved in cell wall biosynthesis
MSSHQRILFYSDAPEFGGHEAMTVQAVDYLCTQSDHETCFAYYEGNPQLAKRLTLIASKSRLRLLPISFCSRTLQALRSIVFRTQVKRIQELLMRVEPQMVVVVQGRIESGSAALLAAKRAKVRIVSYIPMAHPVSVVGRPIASSLRDAVNRYFYRLPDKFITISNGVREMLQLRGVRSPIAVVPNGIDLVFVQRTDRDEFRQVHGISAHQYVVAVVGRIDFRQKGQDFALRAFARLQRESTNWKLLFVGSGPDESNLRRMIRDLKLSSVAEVLPWSTNPAKVYSGIDLLLIPSRFEGVPLVMLEAMSCGLPIVASDVDGMAESLPKSWLFPSGNTSALIKALATVRSENVSHLLDENRRKVSMENSFASFGPRFAQAALGSPQTNQHLNKTDATEP